MATIKYKKSFCKRLIEHMKTGKSFDSFAAVVGVSRQTLHNWAMSYPAFRESREKGEMLKLLHYEEVAQAAMTGQLRAVKSRSVALDENGQPIRDANGHIVYNTEYQAVRINSAIFRTMLQISFRSLNAYPLDEQIASDKEFKDMPDDQLEAELKKAALQVIEGGNTGKLLKASQNKKNG